MASVNTKPKEAVKEERKAPKATTGSTVVLRGICVTCNYAADCAHLKRNPDVVIWHCEDYDDHVAPGETVPEVGVLAVDDDEVSGVETENATAELKGLCVDCENRDGCAHAIKTGGVWHCEDYE